MHCRHSFAHADANKLKKMMISYGFCLAHAIRVYGVSGARPGPVEPTGRAKTQAPVGHGLRIQAKHAPRAAPTPRGSHGQPHGSKISHLPHNHNIKTRAWPPAESVPLLPWVPRRVRRRHRRARSRTGSHRAQRTKARRSSRRRRGLGGGRGPSRQGRMRRSLQQRSTCGSTRRGRRQMFHQD